MLNTDKIRYIKNKVSFSRTEKRKGLSLTEMAISTLILALIMTGAAGFSSEFFNASATSSLQLLNVSQAREIGQNISNEIANSSYIYPPGVTIGLSTTHPATDENWDFNINTTDSVAMLFGEDPNNDGNIIYGFVAFFLMEGDGTTSLYQFIDSPSYTWDENTSPASELTGFTGNSSIIITDIDSVNTNLSYIFNYSNGITDEILKGEISGIAIDDPNSLIKGIDWEIAQNNVETQTIKIKGLSRNVPRFIE